MKCVLHALYLLSDVDPGLWYGLEGGKQAREGLSSVLCAHWSIY